MRDHYDQLLTAKQYDALERALLSEKDRAVRRHYARALFSEAMRGPGPPDANWVKRLVHQGHHRALTSADQAVLAKEAYSSVSSGLEANIAAWVVQRLSD